MTFRTTRYFEKYYAQSLDIYLTYANCFVNTTNLSRETIVVNFPHHVQVELKGLQIGAKD